MSDIYDILNGSGSVGDDGVVTGGGAQDADALMKAVQAGTGTGRDYNGVENVGESLKVESLDGVVKVLTSKEDQHAKLFKAIAKNTIYNTVHEFNQQLDYGNDAGGFNLEGETPQQSDPTYRRRSALIKYMGFVGEVTHASTLVKNADGVNNLARETENKTQLLMRFINKKISTANSKVVPTEFDGLFQQHFEDADVGNSNLDTYFGSTQVIDARGSILTDDIIQDATDRAITDNFGYADTLIADPKVFKNYAKQFDGLKRFNVGMGGAIQGAVGGQSFKGIESETLQDIVKPFKDIFFDYKVPKNTASAATSSKAPAAPVKDGVAPTAVVTGDSKANWTNYTGTYFYAVTALNRYGESAPTVLNTTALTVNNATDAVNLKFTAGAGAYAATGYRIYRSEVNHADYTSAKAFYPIFDITAAELAAGYDGGAAGLVKDRNRWIPNAKSALVTTFDSQYFDYLQLLPISKMKLALTSPAFRFMVLNYGTPAMYQASKIVRIVNLGEVQPS